MTVNYITKAFLGCRGGWSVYLNSLGGLLRERSSFRGTARHHVSLNGRLLIGH
jgi:hypothetical protein